MSENEEELDHVQGEEDEAEKHDATSDGIGDAAASIEHGHAHGHHHHGDEEDGFEHHHHHGDDDDDDDDDDEEDDEEEEGEHDGHHHHHHHHHSEAEEFAEQTSAVAITRDVKLDTPIARTELEQRMRDTMKGLSEAAAIEGIVLGHLKGIAKAGGTTYLVSSTREDVVDERAGEGWDALDKIDSFTFTFDLITIQPFEYDEDEICKKIIEG